MEQAPTAWDNRSFANKRSRQAEMKTGESSPRIAPRVIMSGCGAGYGIAEMAATVIGMSAKYSQMTVEAKCDDRRNAKGRFEQGEEH